jgi:hypothetical protein
MAHTSRSFKVNLNSQASDELKKTAEILGISETEVLRRGLSIMRHYSEAREKDCHNHLILKEGEKERELIVV